MLKIIKGDLFDGYQYIAHQTNCYPGAMGGLAGEVLRRYPYANTRNGVCKPGEIDVFKPVINMYAQVNLGSPNRYETERQRLQWFRSCLIKITKINDLRQIAFPYGIGCGLGGGDWLKYENLLIGFANYMFNKYATEVYVVKL